MKSILPQEVVHTYGIRLPKSSEDLEVTYKNNYTLDDVYNGLKHEEDGSFCKCSSVNICEECEYYTDNTEDDEMCRYCRELPLRCDDCDYNKSYNDICLKITCELYDSDLNRELSKFTSLYKTSWTDTCGHYKSSWDINNNENHQGYSNLKHDLWILICKRRYPKEYKLSRVHVEITHR